MQHDPHNRPGQSHPHPSTADSPHRTRSK
jgi:hypothetical protein